MKQGPRYLEIAASAAAEDAAHARLIRSRLGSRPEEIKEARADAAARPTPPTPTSALTATPPSTRNRRSRRKNSTTPEPPWTGAGVLAAAQAKLALVEAGNRIEDVEEAAALWRQARANHQLLVEQTPLDVKAAEGKVEQAHGKVEEIEADVRELVVKAPEPA